MSKDESSSSDTKITNQQMKRDALHIIHKSIQAVDPYAAIKSHLKLLVDDFQLDENLVALQVDAANSRTCYNMNFYEKIVLIAFGKASSAMATAVVQQLSSSATKNKQQQQQQETMGVCICKDDHATQEEIETLQQFGCVVKEASHPVPDQRSASAAQQALQLVQQHASPSTLVICCVSGGGSALFCQPQDGLTLNDLQITNQALLASGMSIQDCNIIRKRLEQGKGGRLAQACYPSQLITLVLSDGA